MPGQFIVIDGPDGSGTTLHSELLTARLVKAGIPVHLTAEPTNQPIGQHIRDLLNGQELPSADAIQLLFCADRAAHLATEIEPALAAGETIVCDRYIYSTLVYGAALGLDRTWLEAVNAPFRPADLTIVTLPPLAVCQERLGRRQQTDHLEEDSLQTKVYEGYQALSGPNLITVDTSGDKTETAQTIWEHVESHLHQVQS